MIKNMKKIKKKEEEETRKRNKTNHESYMLESGKWRSQNKPK